VKRGGGQWDFVCGAVHEFGNVEKFSKYFVGEKKGRNELRPYKKLPVTFNAMRFLISWSA
jgi:hypothetical protein